MQPETAPRYAVVDVETTGFGQHDRVLEVAIVHLNAAGEVEGTWSTLINPGRDIPNSHIHGIHARDVLHAPSFGQIAAEVARRLDGRVFVAHNASFDSRMLRAEFDRAGLELEGLGRHHHCTMVITGEVHPYSGRSLEAALKRAGLNNEWAHSAEGDARATAALFRHYLDIGALNPSSAVTALGWAGDSEPNESGTPQSVAVVQREDTRLRMGTWLYQLASGLPFKGRPHIDAYIELLQRALADEHIDGEEVEELLDLAKGLGISREEAVQIHREFAHSLALLAWADGVVTPEEREQLATTACQLGVPWHEVEQWLAAPPEQSDAVTGQGAVSLRTGDRVTFTGQLELPREVWEERSRLAGLEVGGVSRKSACLVAADPDSGSRKARRARELGIPIIDEVTFAHLLGQLSREPVEDDENGQRFDATQAVLDRQDRERRELVGEDPDGKDRAGGDRAGEDLDGEDRAGEDQASEEGEGPGGQNQAEPGDHSPSVAAVDAPAEVVDDLVRVFPWLAEVSPGPTAAVNEHGEADPELVADLWITSRAEQPLFRMSPELSSDALPRLLEGTKTLVQRWRAAYPEPLNASVEDLTQIAGVGPTAVRHWAVGVAHEALHSDAYARSAEDDGGQGARLVASDIEEDLVGEVYEDWKFYDETIDQALKEMADVLSYLRYRNGDLARLIGPATGDGRQDRRRARLLALLEDKDSPLNAVLASERPAAAEVLRLVYLEADERQRDLMRDRIGAVQPKTLQVIAERFGVSKQRVRQIETKVRKRLSKLLEEGSVADLLLGIRAHAHPVNSQVAILQLFPELSNHVEGWDAPLWQILDQLDDSFTVEDGWVCYPDLAGAVATTQQVLEAAENEDGIVAIDAIDDQLGVPPALAREWLLACGFPIVQDHVLNRRDSRSIRSVAVLSIAGEPMTAEAIFRSAGSSGTLRALKNALSVNDRVVRTGVDTFGLRRWGVEEYTKLTDIIGRRVDAAVEQARADSTGEDAADGGLHAGGAQAEDSETDPADVPTPRVGVTLRELLAELPEKFGVAPSSIKAYAATGEFEIIDGTVYRRENPQVNDAEPEESSGLYRRDGQWQLLATITADHLRGSGFGVPAGMPCLRAVEFGQTITLPSRLGDQPMTWGMLAQCGSIRRFCEDMGLRVGDRVWISDNNGQRFEVEPAPPLREHTGLAAVAAAMGIDPEQVGTHLREDGEAPQKDGTHPQADGAETEACLEGLIAEALGFPATAPRRKILARLRHRRENRLVEILEGLWLPRRTED
ncbi:exonuclease domain-containing protein [Corynebacterium heidelbergense]|uniref:exonuclease domain-containing protein n=1 Tax=Corynebacterium heidelbergense TaxID=2055947 RepID=UPI001402660F|nr:exonuclease domain-containing protein [Corynebacterium heidelbergense]